MDFESRQIEVELENEEFQVDTDVTLSKQFVKNGDYYTAATFVCNLEDTEGFDANLILDRKKSAFRCYCRRCTRSYNRLALFYR